MARSELDNGNAFMRRNTDQASNPYLLAAYQAMAQQMAQQQARNPYNPYNGLNAQLTPRAWSNAQSGAPTPGECEAEDVTGLRMLEEFLAKRKGERDGDERK
jgi:hypothetical protein